jgi:hypothetical protein
VNSDSALAPVEYNVPVLSAVQVFIALERAPIRTTSADVTEACHIGEEFGWIAKDGDTWHLTMKGAAALRWMGAYHCACGWSAPRYLGSFWAFAAKIRAWLHQRGCPRALELLS